MTRGLLVSLKPSEVSVTLSTEACPWWSTAKSVSSVNRGVFQECLAFFMLGTGSPWDEHGLGFRAKAAADYACCTSNGKAGAPFASACLGPAPSASARRPQVCSLSCCYDSTVDKSYQERHFGPLRGQGGSCRLSDA